MYKRFCCLSLFFIAIAFALYGCASASENTDSGVPVSPDYTRVEPLKEYRVTSVLYYSTSEEELINHTDLIFKGIVLDISEYMVDDKYSSCVGLIKYRITDIIYSEDNSIKNADEFYLLTMNTSRRWDSNAIQQELNSEYILFAKIGSDNPENPLRFFYSITKYGLLSPFAGVMTITDDGVKFDGLYSTLAKKARKSTRASYMDYSSDCYVMSEQDYISELQKLIELYKN